MESAECGDYGGMELIQLAGHALGVSLKSFEVRQAQDLLNAFSAIAKQRPGGLLTILDTLVGPYRELIAKVSTENRLPSICDHAESGGLMSYGPSLPEVYRRAASYIDKSCGVRSRATSP